MDVNLNFSNRACEVVNMYVLFGIFSKIDFWCYTKFRKFSFNGNFVTLFRILGQYTQTHFMHDLKETDIFVCSNNANDVHLKPFYATRTEYFVQFRKS